MFKRIRIIIGLFIIFIAYVGIITYFKANASRIEDYLSDLIFAYIMAEGLMYLGGFIGLGMRGYFRDLSMGTRLVRLIITPIFTIFTVYLMIREFFSPN